MTIIISTEEEACKAIIIIQQTKENSMVDKTNQRDNKKRQCQKY